MNKSLKVGVVGAGYVGLVTAVCLASKGFRVILVEADKEKIKSIEKEEVPFFEPGLGVFLKSAFKKKLIELSDSIESLMLQKPEIVFSCVGTPSSLDGTPDLSSVWSVVNKVGYLAESELLFVHKSTVPVGTTRKTDEILKKMIKERGLEFKIFAASNPEFLAEGTAVSNFMTPNRIVCGVGCNEARDILFRLHKPFLADDSNFISMGFEAAEMTKYAANAMLATRISFINQLALLADKTGADINDVRRGIGSDKRIGNEFLAAGIGYGGSCFSKDLKALNWMGKLHGVEMSLAVEVERINYNQRKQFAKKILDHYGPEISGKQVGIWGLSFKPGTDDMREAPSILLIKSMLEQGANIRAYDPEATVKRHFANDSRVVQVKTARAVLEHSDFLVILTEWDEFLGYTAEDFALLTDKTVFDGRNCFDPREMISRGITYFCVGRNLFVKRRTAGKEVGNIFENKSFSI